jgi:hypothetical protein
MASFTKVGRFAIASTAAAEITVPATRVLTLRKVVLRNHTGADKTITIHLAEDGGAAATTNIIYSAVVAAGQEAFPNLPGMSIPQGGKLYFSDAVGAESVAFVTASESTQGEDAEYA